MNQAAGYYNCHGDSERKVLLTNVKKIGYELQRKFWILHHCSN